MTRNQIIEAGVRNLREFGYPSVNAENILTDAIYSQLFKSILEGNLGDPAVQQDVLKELIAEVESNDGR